MSKQFYFKQFSLNVKTVNPKPWFSSIWPLDSPLSGATTSGQSGPESDGNKGVLRIHHSSSIPGTSPSDYLMSYLGHLFGLGSYPSAEVQSMYSTALADWANRERERERERGGEVG